MLRLFLYPFYLPVTKPTHNAANSAKVFAAVQILEEEQLQVLGTSTLDLDIRKL